MKKQNLRAPIFFYILIRSWRAFPYLERCIDSVLSQEYPHFRVLFVDDASDYSTEQKQLIRRKLTGHEVVFNKTRKYAVRNAYEMIHRYAADDDAVVVNLDGDDWFSDSDTLAHLAEIYTKPRCLLAYGECYLWDNDSRSKLSSRYYREYTNIPYPPEVTRERSYRSEPFYPLHPRSWKVWLYKKIRKADFLRSNGVWLRHCEDLAMFFPMLEMVGGRYAVAREPLYVYNRETNHADMRIHLYELVRDELEIRKKPPYAPFF